MSEIIGPIVPYYPTLFERLVKRADEGFDGELAISKSQDRWLVEFGDIAGPFAWGEGPTFEAAALAALARGNESSS